MKYAFYTVLILIFVLLASCKKEKLCPTFNQEDLKIIPYFQNDTIRFINQDNEFFEIYTKDFSFSENYTVEYKSVLFNVKEEACLNHAELNASDSQNTKKYIFLELEQSDMSAMQYFKYQLLDFYFEIDFDNEIPFIDQFDYMELIPQFSINDTNYTNVVLYKDIENSSKKIHSVYLNKKDGILKFIEDGTGNKWLLVD